MTSPPQISPLERIAGLLEPIDRDRFLTLATRLRSLQHDDEILMIVEAIGFMTMIWKAVPTEVQRILEGANPLPDTCANLTKTIQDAVSQAIPSQQDLRTIVQTLREHEVSLRNLCRKDPPSNSATHTAWLIAIIFAIATLLLLAERYQLIQFTR